MISPASSVCPQLNSTLLKPRAGSESQPSVKQAATEHRDSVLIFEQQRYRNDRPYDTRSPARHEAIIQRTDDARQLQVFDHV